MERSIITGNGPDLFAEDAVSDIYGLAAKGVLENLEPYLEQDGMDREAYTSAAFQSFGREGGIYGMGYEMQVTTIYMKEELVGDNPEVLLDNLENYDGQAVFNALYNYTPGKLLEYFFKMSEDFYGMVDWEEKTCSFSGELWERILRIAKQYGVTDQNRQWDEIAVPVYKKILQECVMAEEEQWYYNVSVLPEEREAWKEQILARFWECLDNAEPAPYRVEHIIEIIREEAELYFTGDKTIEEVSAIMENRVRLYLAELE